MQSLRSDCFRKAGAFAATGMFADLDAGNISPLFSFACLL